MHHRAVGPGEHQTVVARSARQPCAVGTRLTGSSVPLEGADGWLREHVATGVSGILRAPDTVAWSVRLDRARRVRRPRRSRCGDVRRYWRCIGRGHRCRRCRPPRWVPRGVAGARPWFEASWVSGPPFVAGSPAEVRGMIRWRQESDGPDRDAGSARPDEAETGAPCVALVKLTRVHGWAPSPVSS